MNQQKKVSINSFKKQGGYTIAELVVVLVVGSILAGIAIYGWGTTHQAKSADENAMLSSATQCARSVFSNSPDFSQVTTSTLAAPANNCFPSKDVSGTSGSYTVKDSSGYTVTATPATLANSNDSIEFTISAVSSQDCAQMMQSLASSASQLTGGTGSNVVTVLPFGGTYNTANALTACSGTANQVNYYVTK